MRIICLSLALQFFLVCNVFSQQDVGLTYYEKSGYISTPGYEETIQYAKSLANKSNLISYTTFGVSPQGRQLPPLIINNSDKTDVASIKGENKTVVLIQACIHAGESDGKDAGLMLLRDMAIRRKHLDLLDSVAILFVPIFNVDGHERFDKYNRINQNGPEEMGWRATAQRLNLNRDYLKADAPEMQAMIELYQNWLPDFYIDCHVTDGADYVYPLTYGLQINGNLNESQSSWLKDTYLPYVTSDGALRSAHSAVYGFCGMAQSKKWDQGLFRNATILWWVCCNKQSPCALDRNAYAKGLQNQGYCDL